MMILVVPIIALLGVLLYWFAKDRKSERIGEVVFQAGLVVFLLWLEFAPHAAKLFNLSVFGR